MQGLIVLAVVWFVVAQIAKVAKRARRREARDGEQAPREYTQAEARRQERAPAAAGTQTTVWDQIAEMYEETERARGSEGYAHSDEGCIGGSIKHDQHEGSFAPGSLDYTPPVYTAGSLEYKPTTVYNPVVFGETHVESRTGRTRLTGARMRSAVIAAEILGKPVALRHD